MILEDGGNSFVVNKTYNIINRGSGDCATCTNSGDFVTCCDVTNIDDFDLPMDFVFGVTESASGNTHGVTLSGFHDSSPYLVDTIQHAKTAVNLSLGSIPSRSASRRGLRMLWFVIGN